MSQCLQAIFRLLGSRNPPIPVPSSEVELQTNPTVETPSLESEPEPEPEPECEPEPEPLVLFKPIEPLTYDMYEDLPDLISINSEIYDTDEELADIESSDDEYDHY